MATYTEKIQLLIAGGQTSMAMFADSTEEEVVAHAFKGVIDDLWTNYIAAAKKTAVKKILTPEEKLALIQKGQTELFESLAFKESIKEMEAFRKTYAFLGETQLKLVAKKATLIGIRQITVQMEKAGKSAPKATKTLATGREVANHNNHYREEEELVKNEDGTKMEVKVKFRGGKEEMCGVIENPGDAKMTEGWTFKELDGLKSVERAQKGYSQVFIKKMWFQNPTHIEGRCGCACEMNKKLKQHAAEESVDEDGNYSYVGKKLDNPPRFACNKPISENGMCKAHNKNPKFGKWTEEMLNGWTPQQISL